jgi:filamentous hemagglutinin
MEILSGAGGSWRVIDEIADRNVVQQQDQISCAAACGEMLLRDRQIYDVNQSIIAAEVGVPMSAEDLANVLNQLDYNSSRVWLGGTVSLPETTDADLETTYSEIIDILMSTGSWVAALWESLADLGHIVVVDGIDRTGNILIRDPWNATSYKMNRKEFINYWNSQAIYSLRQ